MEKVPYNLYINYEELSTLFNESESRHENLIRCGVAAIELTTHMLGSFIKETGRTDSDKVADLVRGLETQVRLLSSYAQAFPGGHYQERHSPNIENLRLLDPSYTGDVDRISKFFFQISIKVKTGLETQINEIRAHFGLPRMIVGIATMPPKLGVSGNSDLAKLSKVDYYNSEDEIFMRVHQISEYWFNVAIKELKAIDIYFQEANTDAEDINKHFKMAYEILIFLAEHILLLEHMVLSDYHPLRVALRGASGGQSHQAHEVFGVARKIYGQFMGIMAMKGKTIVQVLENPKREGRFLSIINNFSKLERALKGFFFQHYNLSSGTIGSQSFGSIGYDLVTLTNKFVNPIFKEIDEAKYDFTLKTNFQYGDSSGLLIKKEENFSPNHDKHTICTNETIIESVINDYFKHISALDMEAWVGLFSADGYIEDPVGTRPYVGHKELSVFFKGVLRFFAEINMTMETKTVFDNRTEVEWTAQAKTYNGKSLKFKGKEVFYINAEGEIFAAEVYWGPKTIADQL